MFSKEALLFIKEWAQVFGLAAVVLGLLRAAWEIRQNRKQRDTELLWKKINTAKELLNDIHTHDYAKNAVHMLDWCEGQSIYKDVPGEDKTISYRQVIEALKKNSMQDCTEKDEHIRDCFDWLFYRVDRIEHYIRRQLIDFRDVEGVFRIYARLINKDRQVYQDFLEFHGYYLAEAFFERFWSPPETWLVAAAAVSAPSRQFDWSAQPGRRPEPQRSSKELTTP